MVGCTVRSVVTLGNDLVHIAIEFAFLIVVLTTRLNISTTEAAAANTAPNFFQVGIGLAAISWAISALNLKM